MQTIPQAAPVYQSLYRRYMESLNIQYTAFKEMLLGLAGHTIMNVSGINNHGTGNGAELLLAEPFPLRASEAYLFSPPGYWDTVYDNPLYPDDSPTDLMSSINGGATTVTVPGSYTDGHYLMLYNISDVWRKIEFDIADGKVHCVNNRNVANMPEGIDCLFGHYDGFAIDIDINSAELADIDTEIKIAVTDGSEIDVEFTVATNRETDLPAEIFTWFSASSDLTAEIWTPATGILASELTVKYHCWQDLASELTVKYECSELLDAAIFVWFAVQHEIEAAISVYQHSSLAAEILIEQQGNAELDAAINIQQTDGLDIESQIVVRVFGADSKRFLDTEMTVAHTDSISIASEISVIGRGRETLAAELEIEAKNVVSAIPAEVHVIQQDASAIDSTIVMCCFTVMEPVANTRPQGHSLIDGQLTVVFAGSLETDGELIVVAQEAVMEAGANVVTEAIADLDAEVAVACSDLLPSEIAVQARSGMETVIGVQVGAHSQLSSEILVNRKSQADVAAELIVTATDFMEAAASIKQGNYHDISSEISIYQNDCRSIEAELTIVAETVMEAVSDTHSYSAELISEITLVVTGQSEIGSEINIRSKTAMEAVADMLYVVRNDLGSEMVVVHSQSSEIDATVNITNTTAMEVAAGLFNGGQADLSSEICLAHLTDAQLDSEMMVNPAGVMEAVVFYRNNIQADLDSELALTESADLSSAVYIVDQDDKEVMEVIAHTLPAVLRVATVSAVKDAVCYSYTALTNYGTLPEISVGRFTGGETFKSVVGFDLTLLEISHDDSMNYFGYETVQKAMLKLYVTRPMAEAGATLKVYRVSDSWAETKVTYRSLDTLDVYEQVAQVAAPRAAGDIAIDITSGFTDWAHKSDRQSFMIIVEDHVQVTRNGVYFSSREGFRPPRLEVQFYRSFSNGEWLDTDSAVFVNPNSNIDCEIYVADPSLTEVECSLEIAVQGISDTDIDADIDIVANNLASTQIDAEIEIIGYPDKADLDSECFVIFWTEQFAVDSELTVVRHPQHESYVYIL